MIVIKERGLKETQAALRRVGKEIDRQANPALAEIGRIVQSEGKQNTPISPTKAQARGTGYNYKIGRAPGTLTESIEMIQGNKQVTVGVVHGAAMQYAEFIDKGNYKPGPGSRAKGDRARQHFMDRAWDDREKEYIAMYARLGVDRAIKRF